MSEESINKLLDNVIIDLPEGINEQNVEEVTKSLKKRLKDKLMKDEQTKKQRRNQ